MKSKKLATILAGAIAAVGCSSNDCQNATRSYKGKFAPGYIGYISETTLYYQGAVSTTTGRHIRLISPCSSYESDMLELSEGAHAIIGLCYADPLDIKVDKIYDDGSADLEVTPR